MKYDRIDSFKNKIAYAEAGKDSFYLYQDNTEKKLMLFAHKH